jgi:sulfite exporter TauE/SafE
MLALPFSNYDGKERVGVILLYHFGRIVAYGVLGILVGFLGDALIFTGIGRWLSIAIGFSLLVFLIYKGQRKRLGIWGGGGRLLNRIMQYGSRLGWKGFFVLGIGNGLLPCGMVYSALAIGITTGSSVGGLLVMIVFGIGTLPFILYFTMGFHSGIRRLRAFIQQKTFWIQLLIACLLIIRGLNLDIPYISPTSISAKHGNLVSCFK